MSHNPLAPELEAKAAELEDLRSRHVHLSSALDWYSTFDRASAEKKCTRQRDQRDELKNKLGAVRDEIAAAKRQASKLRAKREAGWDPRYWFSKDRAEAKKQFAAQTRRLADLDARQAELESRLDRARTKLKRTRKAIARYDQFDQVAASAELAALDTELPVREREHEALAVRKERLDRQLEGAVASLEELQADLKKATSRRSSLHSDIDRLDRDIKKATQLDKELSAAADSRERWEIHQECEDEFDDGSPRHVLSDRRRKLTDTRHEISNLDRRIPGIERNVKKAEQRVASIVTRGIREIRAVVIDGNNLCYQDGTFIGIAALRPLCVHLQERYEVTLVFDASIRPLLSGTADKSHWVTEENLRERFPDTTVHIVTARTQADETILAAASDPGVYVLSNDRFAEYSDKPPVRDNRLITHEILNGQILVHDLDISLPFIPRPD